MATAAALRPAPSLVGEPRAEEHPSSSSADDGDVSPSRHDERGDAAGVVDGHHEAHHERPGREEQEQEQVGLSLASRSPSPVLSSHPMDSTTVDSTAVDAALLPRPRLEVGHSLPMAPPSAAMEAAADASMDSAAAAMASAAAWDPATEAAAAAAAATNFTTAAMDPSPEGGETSRLEARIARLEQSLGAVTHLCQELLQQQQQQQRKQQQQQQHREEKHGGHSREGSQSTGGSCTPGSASPNHDDSDDPRLLSQWPPSHHLLDSPDVYVRSRGHRSRSRPSSRPSYPRRRSSSASASSHTGARKQKGLGTTGKTMSMVLLDIDPGESRGPSMIPFVSDLDACDEMDGDSVAGGCRDGRNGGGRAGGGSSGSSRSGSESASVDSSGRSGSVEKQRLASSPRNSCTDTDEGGSSSDESRRRGDARSPRRSVECQAYTTTHLEALRLRCEAGKGRAYSFNDALSRGDAAAEEGESTPRQQWKPTLDAVDGSVKEPDSAVSAESSGSFVDVRPRESIGEAKELDIDMPDLSSAETNATAPRKGVKAETISVGTNTSMDNMVHSTSCASNMSSDTTKTLKSGNTNVQSSSSKDQKPHTGSESSKERSQSISSSDAAISSKREGKGRSPRKSEGKSPRKGSSESTAAAPAPDNGKNAQTMKEYVINDLLNIDSRNQDGSATEDIDANMEEFLRIPSKLEYLMLFSLMVCMDSFLYAWAMLPLKFVWGWICLACSAFRPGKGGQGIRFHRRHLYPLMQSVLIWFVYSQVLCPISIGKLYHWIRGQAMLKLYVVIAIVEVFDRLLCSFGQDAWDSLYWNTTRRPRHPRMFVSIIVVGVYVTIHSLFLFVHVATLSVAVNSADNALMTLLIGGNFAEIKSTVFKKYNKQNLFKITTSDICERFKLALFLLLILFLNRFQGEMTTSMMKDYYSMCGMIFAAELISDWIKHSFITKFNLIKSSTYFDYALVLSGDVTGIGHEGLNLDYTHAAVKRLGLAQIPLVCVTARYLHEAVRFAIAFQGNGDMDHPVSALIDLMADGNKWKFYTGLFQCMFGLVLFKIALGMCIRYVARGYLGGASGRVLKTATRKSSVSTKLPKKESEMKKKQ